VPNFLSFSNTQKKRKIRMMVHVLCSELEESIAKFIHGIGKLDEDLVSATKRPRTLAEKAGPHMPGKRQRVPPPAETSGPHKSGKRQRVTHEEDSEPLLADMESNSSDDGVAVPEKLCDDDESDKSSEVSKEDDDEEEEKEDDEEEEEKEDDEEEEEEKEDEVDDDKEEDDDHRKEDSDKHGDAYDDDEDNDGERQYEDYGGGQMMSSMDVRTKATLRGAMMLMKTISRNVKKETYPTMMMTGASMRDHNSMKVQQMTTYQLMKEQYASTMSAPADR
jgi:hypothetical protein